MEGALLDGKAIERIERHSEFVRVHVAGGGFELCRCQDAQDPWCAGPLRLQPLPGQEADEAALTRRLAEVRALPAATTAPALAPPGAGAVQDDGQGVIAHWLGRLDGGAAALGLIPALLALAGLCFGLLATRDHPAARRGVGWVAALTIAAPLLGRSLLGPDSVPSEVIAHLHESNARDTAALLTERYAMHHPAWLLTSAERGIHGIVAANRLLWALGVAAMVVWMRCLLPNWRLAVLVVALVAGTGFNVALRNAELETPEIWVAICAGAAAFAVADDVRRRPWTRWLATAYLPSLVTMVDRRHETVLIVAAALLVLALRQLRRRDAVRSWLDAKVARALDVATRPASLLVFTAVVVVQGLLQSQLAELAEPIGVALNSHLSTETIAASSWMGILPSVLPTDLTFVFLLLNLASWSNLLLAALVLCGVYQTVSRRRDWLWLLLTVATVYKIYRAAGHAFPFEVVRYLATLAPLLAAFAALGVDWGWPRLQALTPTPGQRRVALAAIGLTALVDARYGALNASMGDWLTLQGPVGDQQIAFHVMTGALDRYPDCAIVTRNTIETNTLGEVEMEELIVFGAGWDRVTTIASVAEIPRVLGALSPPARCAMVLDGLDCRCAGGEGCHELGEGPPLIGRAPTAIAYRHGHWGRPMDDVSPFTLRRLRADLDPTQR